MDSGITPTSLVIPSLKDLERKAAKGKRVLLHRCASFARVERRTQYKRYKVSLHSWNIITILFSIVSN